MLWNEPFCLSPTNRFTPPLCQRGVPSMRPMHRTLKPKTLQSILKQANLTVEQLMELL